MLKKKRISVSIAFILVMVVLAGTFMYVAVAANPSEPYTVLVKYYDSVQIEYALTPETDKFHVYDVPIGGIGNISASGLSGGLDPVVVHQAYCIDPFTPFAGRDDTIRSTSGPAVTNPYIDTFDLYGGLPTYDPNYTAAGEAWGVAVSDYRSDYHAVPPWIMSDAMKANYNAVLWLVYNGYRGDFRRHNFDSGSFDDGESIASLDRLNALYGTGIGAPYIDKSIALMATKIAIWRVLTDGQPGSFVLRGTNLDGFPGRRAVIDNLVTKLIEGARAAPASGAPGIPYTDMSLSIAAPNILTGGVYPAGTGFAYYPLSVLTNFNTLGSGVTAQAAGLQVDVFLTVSGPYAREVRFASRLPDGSFAELGTGVFPGTTNNLQYETGSFTGNSSEIDVFLKVPLSRIELLGPEAVGSELLRIRAMAHVPDVPVEGGTPLPIAAVKDGVQGWDIVQAFIGAATLGSEISMYDEAFLDVRGAREGELEISKRLKTITEADEDRYFTFALYAGFDLDFNSSYRVRLDFHTIDPASSRIAGTDTFRLKHGETIKITGLPEHFNYWLIELNDGTDDFIAPWYEFPAGIPEAGINFPARAVSSSPVIDGFRTCRFALGEQAKAVVTVTNTREENGEKAVQTGVDRSLTLPVIALALGVLFIAGAEVHRRKMKKKADRSQK